MMKRSLERGLGRGQEPKRSRSPRGPPVCMSSMAQHARPKSMNHTLFERPQLRSEFTTASTFVWMTLPPSSAYLGEPQPLGGAIKFRALVSEAMSLSSLRDGVARHRRLGD